MVVKVCCGKRGPVRRTVRQICNRGRDRFGFETDLVLRQIWSGRTRDRFTFDAETDLVLSLCAYGISYTRIRYAVRMYKVCKVQYTVYNQQYTVCARRYAVYKIRYTVRGMRARGAAMSPPWHAFCIRHGTRKQLSCQQFTARLLHTQAIIVPEKTVQVVCQPAKISI